MVKDSEIGKQFVVRVWCENAEESDDAIRGSIHCVGADHVTFFVGLGQLVRQFPASVRDQLFRGVDK